MPSLVHGELSLLEVLDQVCRADGPVRLFSSKRGVQELGLFPARLGPVTELLDSLLGTLLTETPRAANQPRRVVPTNAGLTFLIRHLPPAERANRVRTASPLYRDRLLRMWKEVASPSELELLRTTVGELYGDLLESRAEDARAFERARAKELVLSWTRADDPEVRAGLARAMESLGLRRLGTVGEEVSFSGRHHLADESLFPGDPVAIILEGWVAVDPNGDTILQKAHVRLLP